MIELRLARPDKSEKDFSFEKEQIFFGKHPANDLSLNHASAGLRHARLCFYRGAWWVEDLKSPTGTRVNGELLTSPRVVAANDKIELAEHRITVLSLGQTVQSASSSPLLAAQTAAQGRAQVSAPPANSTPRPPAPPSDTPTRTIPLSPPPEQPVESPVAPPPAKARAPESVWHPPSPKDADDTGLRRTVIVDLILKSIYFAGELSGYDLREQTRLPYDVIEPIIAELRRDKLMDIKGGGGSFGSISMTYLITNKGTENIRQILDRNRYIGPTPVTMDTYLKGVEAQSVRKLKIPRRTLVKAFGHLVVQDYIYDGIGPALNSGTAILFYGPPGNGKTAICQGMVNCLGDGIYIPYAIEADGNIIKVFDEHNHKPIPRPEGFPSEFDQRYVYCQRPLIMVGGELTLDMLDMSYSTDAKYYEAPFQMKANGGILLVDDFGRQKVSPKDLLNRWIVPLESQIDFISLVTGRKLKIPFDVFVAFATNLNPDDLVDDAFLRRVRYKLEVQRPSPELFRHLFEMTCRSQDIPFEEAGYAHLLSLYQRDNRPMNACEPRNMVSAVVSLSDYFERPPRLDLELIERAYKGYFTRFSQGGKA